MIQTDKQNLKKIEEQIGANLDIVGYAETNGTNSDDKFSPIERVPSRSLDIVRYRPTFESHLCNR